MKRKRSRKLPGNKEAHPELSPDAPKGVKKNSAKRDIAGEENSSQWIAPATIVDVVRLPTKYGGVVLQWRFVLDADPGSLATTLTGFNPIKNSPLAKLLTGLGITPTPDLWFKEEMVVGKRCIIKAAFTADGFLNVKAILSPLNTAAPNSPLPPKDDPEVD